MIFAIKNLTRKKISDKNLKNAAGAALKILSIKDNIEISLVVCGDRKMKNLNKIYRKKDGTTDVLSFSATEWTKDQKRFIYPANSAFCLGEIFISLPEAERQGRKYNESLDRVLARLLIHGILHLEGYDHEKGETGAKKMFKLQEEILTRNAAFSGG